MVWERIILNGCIYIYIFTNATINSEIYKDDVLDPHVILFRDVTGNMFLVIDDNTRPYCAVLLNNYFDGKII